MEYMPKVLQAVAGEDFTLYLYFSDGSVRLYDAKPILERGGVFEPMRDENFFREHLTVLNDTAAWDVNGDFDPCSCIDLDPIELYESSVVVADPLETASLKITPACTIRQAGVRYARKQMMSVYGLWPMPPSSVRVSPDIYLKSGMASWTQTRPISVSALP